MHVEEQRVSKWRTLCTAHTAGLGLTELPRRRMSTSEDGGAIDGLTRQRHRQPLTAKAVLQQVAFSASPGYEAHLPPAGQQQENMLVTVSLPAPHHDHYHHRHSTLLKHYDESADEQAKNEWWDCRSSLA